MGKKTKIEKIKYLTIIYKTFNELYNISNPRFINQFILFIYFNK